MKPSKNLLFTFDYELFLGRKSGSVEKCMLAPTRQLIGLFERYGITAALFFVDATYLLKLKEAAKDILPPKLILSLYNNNCRN